MGDGEMFPLPVSRVVQCKASMGSSQAAVQLTASTPDFLHLQPPLPSSNITPIVQTHSISVVFLPLHCHLSSDFCVPL